MQFFRMKVDRTELHKVFSLLDEIHQLRADSPLVHLRCGAGARMPARGPN